MFYVPYQFRQQKEFCVPRGPNFNSAPVIKTTVNGTEISLKIPRHKTATTRESKSPRRRYELDPYSFSSWGDDTPGWGYVRLFKRSWDFNGPWFTGKMANLIMNCGLLQLPEKKRDISLFHPRAFEATIAEMLTLLHGEHLSPHRQAQDWFAPVNWQPLSQLPSCAVRFDCTENRAVASDRLERFLMMPVHDHYMLVMIFYIERGLCYIHSDIEPEDNKDDWISEEPMKTLADQVMGSLQVKLSPEAKAQQQKALAGLTETALVKEFAPLKWI